MRLSVASSQRLGSFENPVVSGLRFVTSSARWSELFFRRAAEAVAATSSGLGILFEQSIEQPAPLLLASDRRLQSVLASDAASVPGELLRITPVPRLLPSRAGHLDLGLLFPESARETGEPPHAALSASSTLPTPVRTDDWVGVQTHWHSGEAGTLWVHRRFVVSPRGGGRDAARSWVGLALARQWSNLLSQPVGLREVRANRARLRDWVDGTLARFRSETFFRLSPAQAAAAVLLPFFRAPPPECDLRDHRIVFGASGAGKTSYLAEVSSRVINAGRSVVAFDLHGDLGPAIVQRLEKTARRRLVAIDPSEAPGPGVAVLGTVAAENRERDAAHLVAALKRLSSEGAETYWGFRLERIFDTFVRLVQEEGGTLIDLHAMLTDPRRREAARLTTVSPDVARFLDELPAILRRNPEFLWPAAARLSKVALVPSLTALLSPREVLLPISDILRDGRSIIFRIPLGELGPDASAFAATLILSRLYLTLSALRTESRASPEVVLALDEAQAFSPRLLAEILSEGRKFGVFAVVATQFPDRLAPEVRAAAAGAVGTHVVFRVPHASAVSTGRWVGLAEGPAQSFLPELPPGCGLETSPREPLAVRAFPLGPPPAPGGAPVWTEAVRATIDEFGSAGTDERSVCLPDAIDEAILLATLGAEEEGKFLDARQMLRSAVTLTNSDPDPAEVLSRMASLERRGWVLSELDGFRITPAGSRYLGLSPVTGATRESSEHRALLLWAFRIFARKGYRLEILRQGRFDTRLPDARLRLLPQGILLRPPAEVEVAVARCRSGWAWRYFHGRDVYVEAEVSGALRRERIRAGVSKARTARAFCLFLVGDSERARRVRSVLRSENLYPREGLVWTIRAVAALRPEGKDSLRAQLHRGRNPPTIPVSWSCDSS